LNAHSTPLVFSTSIPSSPEIHGKAANPMSARVKSNSSDVACAACFYLFCIHEFIMEKGIRIPFVFEGGATFVFGSVNLVARRYFICFLP
jgi:hypothetical protein